MFVFDRKPGPSGTHAPDHSHDTKTTQHERAPSAETSSKHDTGPELGALEQKGEPLPKEERDFFEPRFQHDFSRVRVHADDAAARAVQARAYTHGQDIVFGHGEYAPGTPEGRHLLAHELAHVVQQDGPGQARIAASSSPGVSHPKDASEREADAAADAVMSGSSPGTLSHTSATIARQPVLKPGDPVVVADTRFTHNGLQMARELGSSLPVAILPVGALLKLGDKHKTASGIHYATVMKNKTEAYPDAIGIVRLEWVRRADESDIAAAPPPVFPKGAAPPKAAGGPAPAPEEKPAFSKDDIVELKDTAFTHNGLQMAKELGSPEPAAQLMPGARLKLGAPHPNDKEGVFYAIPLDSAGVAQPKKMGVVRTEWIRLVPKPPPATPAPVAPKEEAEEEPAAPPPQKQSGGSSNIVPSPAVDVAVVGTRQKFRCFPAAAYTEADTAQIFFWHRKNDPSTAKKLSKPEAQKLPSVDEPEVVWDFPGVHEVVCRVAYIGPGMRASGPPQEYVYKQAVRDPSEILDPAHAKAEAKGYVHFRVGLEWQLLQEEKQLRDIAGGPAQESGDAPFITSSTASKTDTGWDKSATYTVTPSGKAHHYRWYARCRDWSNMPTEEYHGHRKVSIDGASAYDLGSGTTATFALSNANVFTIVCDEMDESNQPIRSAQYTQVVLSQREWKSQMGTVSQQSAKVEEVKTHIKQVEEHIGKIKADQAKPLLATYLNIEAAMLLPLSLYVGPAASGSGIKLLDLTPGQDRREYDGATIEEALSDFASGNKYPKGTIKLHVPANSAENTAAIDQTITTTGSSSYAAWARGLGWASALLFAAGVVAGIATGGAALVPVLLIGASTAAGAAAGGLSIYDELKKAEPSKTMIALDVVGIAASILGAAGEFRALRQAQGVMLSARATKYLVWARYSTSRVSALLFSVDAFERIDEVLAQKALSDQDKIKAILGIIANALVQVGLFGLEAKQAGKLRSRLEPFLGGATVKKLNIEELHVLGMLDDATLRAAGAMKEAELKTLMQITRMNPRAAPLFVLSGTPVKSTSESWTKMKEVLGAKWDEYLKAVEAAKAKHPELAQIPTEDLVAVHAYTAEDYARLNNPLRYPSENPGELAKMEPVINGAMNAMRALPAYKGKVTRIETTLINAEQYVKGKEVVWRGFGSAYMPGGKVSHKGMAMFTIESVNGRIVEHVAAHAQEKEVLFLPGSRFLVVKVDNYGPVTHVTLKEVP